ncbi:hypothetical protein AB0K08_12250 [Citricoccus sp. NPDC055426]|uniref:hypothetical protein n=1 Tax=Citricoccus sp. NPDC055426 TaxID=3155536 RepID=UPI003425BE98
MSHPAAWRVAPGMTALLRPPRASSLVSQGYTLSGDTLEVLLTPDTTAHQLERTIRTTAGTLVSSYWLVRVLSWGLALFFGVLALLALLILDLFNGLMGRALESFSLSTDWENALLLSTFVIGVVIISFAPQALNAGPEGRVAVMVRRWFGREDQATTRIRRRMGMVTRRGDVARVVVWNAMEPTSLGTSGIAACFRGVPVEVVLRVHHDELEAQLRQLAEAGIEAATFTDPEPDAGPEPRTGAVTGTGGTGLPPADPAPLNDPVAVLRQAFGPVAERALLTAMAFGTLTLGPPWRPSVDAARALPRDLVSGLVLTTLLEEPAPGVGDGEPDGTLWLDRLIADYGLLVAGPMTGGYEFSGPADWPRLVGAHQDTLRSITQRERPSLLRHFLGHDDPTAVLTTLMHAPPAERGQVAYRELLNRYIGLAVSREHYRGLKILAAVIHHEEQGSIADRDLLQMLSIENLTALVSAFLISGDADVALWIADWTRRFTGWRGTLDRALLLESMGRFEEAFTELSLLDERVEAVRCTDPSAAPHSGPVRPGTAGSGAAGSGTAWPGTAWPGTAWAVPDGIPLLSGYLIARTWILLSSGLDRPDAHGHGVRSHLEELTRLQDCGAFTPDPGQARQLENYWALLLEAEGDLPGAVARHALAADMPGVRQRRVLGSLINQGRAEREAAVAAWDGGPDTAPAVLRALGTSIAHLTEGYEGKRRIGDTDEAPIGAHNLALAELYVHAVAQACHPPTDPPPPCPPGPGLRGGGPRPPGRHRIHAEAGRPGP